MQRGHAILAALVNPSKENNAFLAGTGRPAAGRGAEKGAAGDIAGAGGSVHQEAHEAIRMVQNAMATRPNPTTTTQEGDNDDNDEWDAKQKELTMAFARAKEARRELESLAKEGADGIGGNGAAPGSVTAGDSGGGGGFIEFTVRDPATGFEQAMGFSTGIDDDTTRKRGTILAEAAARDHRMELRFQQQLEGQSKNLHEQQMREEEVAESKELPPPQQQQTEEGGENGSSAPAAPDWRGLLQLPSTTTAASTLGAEDTEEPPAAPAPPPSAAPSAFPSRAPSKMSVLAKSDKDDDAAPTLPPPPMSRSAKARAHRQKYREEQRNMQNKVGPVFPS